MEVVGNEEADTLARQETFMHPLSHRVGDFAQ